MIDLLHKQQMFDLKEGIKIGSFFMKQIFGTIISAIHDQI